MENERLSSADLIKNHAKFIGGVIGTETQYYTDKG